MTIHENNSVAVCKSVSNMIYLQDYKQDLALTSLRYKRCPGKAFLARSDPPKMHAEDESRRAGS